MENKITNIIHQLKRYGLSSNDIETWLDTVNVPYSTTIAYCNTDELLIDMLEATIPYMTKPVTIIKMGDKMAPLPTPIAREVIIKSTYNKIYLELMHRLFCIGWTDFSDVDERLSVEDAVAKSRIMFPTYVLN